MNKQDTMALDALIVKVQQQEETIVQLVEMMAVANRRINEINRQLNEETSASFM